MELIEALESLVEMAEPHLITDDEIKLREQYNSITVDEMTLEQEEQREAIDKVKLVIQLLNIGQRA
jgi:hypothetical protein